MKGGLFLQKLGLLICMFSSAHAVHPEVLKAYQKMLPSPQFLEMQAKKIFWQGCGRRNITALTLSQWNVACKKLISLALYPDSFFANELQVFNAIATICKFWRCSAIIDSVLAQFNEYFDAMLFFLNTCNRSWRNIIPNTGLVFNDTVEVFLAAQFRLCGITFVDLQGSFRNMIESICQIKKQLSEISLEVKAKAVDIATHLSDCSTVISEGSVASL